MTRARPFVAGGLIALVYVAVAAWTFQADLVPSRPLFDGLPPLPDYRWVEPPPDAKLTNLPPESGEGVVAFADGTSQAATISTLDGQASVTFPPAAFAARVGESEIRVTVDPLAPTDIAKPPAGLGYEGNAYVVTAEYAGSADPAPLVGVATIVLRYPVNAIGVLLREGDAWRELATLPPSPTPEIVADATSLGIFVASGIATEHPDSPWDIIAAAAGAVIVLGGIVLGRYRARTKEAARRRAVGKKAGGKKAAGKKPGGKKPGGKKPGGKRRTGPGDRPTGG